MVYCALGNVSEVHDLIDIKPVVLMHVDNDLSKVNRDRDSTCHGRQTERAAVSRWHAASVT